MATGQCRSIWIPPHKRAYALSSHALTYLALNDAGGGEGGGTRARRPHCSRANSGSDPSAATGRRVYIYIYIHIYIYNHIHMYVYIYIYICKCFMSALQGYE